MDAQNNVSTNQVMDWDDAIENDGSEYVILPEGDYNFHITDFERGRFPGSAKIPACNKATISAEVKTEDGKTAYVKFDLILYRSLEWRLSGFFRCIGQKKKGERLTMNWNKVNGSRGRAHFKPRTYTNKDGEERQTNDIDYFIDYEDSFFADEDEFMSIPDGVADELPFN